MNNPKQLELARLAKKHFAKYKYKNVSDEFIFSFYRCMSEVFKYIFDSECYTFIYTIDYRAFMINLIPGTMVRNKFSSKFIVETNEIPIHYRNNIGSVIDIKGIISIFKKYNIKCFNIYKFSEYVDIYISTMKDFKNSNYKAIEMSVPNNKESKDTYAVRIAPLERNAIDNKVSLCFRSWM